MMSDEHPPWLPKKRAITDKDWQAFRERYISDLGFSEVPDFMSLLPKTQIFQQETAFLGHNNWPLLMPEDSVLRLRKAEDKYKEFKNIVQETADSALVEATPEPDDLYCIANLIITQFSGSIDFNSSQVRNGDFEKSTDHSHSLYGESTIIVESTNEKNLKDWYVYIVNGEYDKFGEIDSMNGAANSILEADIEPEGIIRNIAITLEDGGMETEPVAGVSPPEYPVSVVKTGPQSRGYYYTIDSPKRVFGDEWGNISSMTQTLAEGDIQSQKIGSGSIDYQVVTGVNW